MKIETTYIPSKNMKPFYFLEKSYHPSEPPPSYFVESPPPYSVVVGDDRSPQTLLDELQPEQRPARHRNVSVVNSCNFCKYFLTVNCRYNHITIGQDLVCHPEEKLYGTSRPALG